MFKAETNFARIVPAIVVILAVVASVGGIVINDLYRDNLLVTSGFYGNDLVTLLVPVLGP